MKIKSRILVIAISWVLCTVLANAQNVTKENVAGIRNFAQVETTVACAGATNPEALAEIKNMGFASVINLRLSGERGNNVSAEAREAEKVGLKFIHLPFNGGSPDPVVADRFIKTITQPGYQPAFIHCAGGVRAAAMWLIKRLVVDKWDVPRAMAEAEALGLTSRRLKQFALDYASQQAQ